MFKSSVWTVVFVFAVAADATSQQTVIGERQGVPISEARPELRLMGTATGDDNTGLAIVGLPDGRVQFLQVGDAMHDYTVTAIEAQRVLMKSAQSEVALELVGGTPSARPASDVARGDAIVAAIRASRANFAEYVNGVWEAVGGGEIRLSGDQLMFMGAEGSNPSGGPVAGVRLPPELGGGTTPGYGASMGGYGATVGGVRAAPEP
jgi:hypothetical protein